MDIIASVVGGEEFPIKLYPWMIIRWKAYLLLNNLQYKETGLPPLHPTDFIKFVT